MRAASLFSGIGCPEVAAPHLDWRFVAEIDPFACAVLEHRFPGVPNLGDVSAPDFAERAGEHGPVDLLVFGTPCQSFSVAGKRLGLGDPRGNMALIALRVAAELRPRWICFENVPGLLSSAAGWDFGAFLRGVEDSGYLGCWRVLDAQFAGVPQRRRRVFFVGHLGDWRPAAAVLFEPESLRGDTAPRREAGQGIARPVAACPEGGSGYRNDADTADNLIAETVGTLSAMDTPRGHGFADLRCNQSVDAGHVIAHSLNAHAGRIDGESETFIAHALDAASAGRCTEDGTGRDTPLVPIPFDPTQITHRENRSRCSPGDHAPSLAESAHAPAVAYQCQGSNVGEAGTLRSGNGHLTGGNPFVVGSFEQNSMGGRGTLGWNDGDHALRPVKPQGDHQFVAFHARQDPDSADVTHPLDTDGFSIGVGAGMAVRRLTPRECERLQGLPDDWTLVPYRARMAADGPRYRVVGNGMAVPVVGWILRRIAEYEQAEAA